MGVLVGLTFGIGALLIWSAFFIPRSPKVESRTGRTSQLLARAGLSDTPAANLWFLCGVLALLFFIAVQALTRAVPVAICFSLMAGYLPVAVLRSRARKRQAEFAEVWPEAVDNLASAVRAGLSLPEAVAALGINGPEPLRPDFAQFALDYQVTGRFSESLDRLKERLADPTGDRVVEGLRIAREVGGGELGRLLRNLSTYLRDEMRTRSELESRQSWTINGARLAVAAPWLVVGFMAFQPELIRGYASVGGALVLGIGGLVCIVAYQLMMRIGRLPTPERVLQ